MRTIETGGITAPQAVGVVGLGLIGASLCRALRETLPDMGIVGITRSTQTADRAMDDGICDLAGTTADLLRHVDVAVLCTPVTDMATWLEHCAAYPDLLVTDCGSTKQWVVEQAARVFDATRFLGGHPMAGRERSGYDAADLALFDGCTWVLTPSADQREQQLDLFRPWVDCIGALHATAHVMDAAAHDRAVAAISHLPFALSAALMRSTATSAEWDHAKTLAASGFRDMVRLSGGDPAMYGAIVATNTQAILDALAALTQELERFAKAARTREGTQGYFTTAQQLRAAWTREREGTPHGDGVPRQG
jgi:prephenate dehydrogenase